MTREEIIALVEADLKQLFPDLPKHVSPKATKSILNRHLLFHNHLGRLVYLHGRPIPPTPTQLAAKRLFPLTPLEESWANECRSGWLAAKSEAATEILQ